MMHDTLQEIVDKAYAAAQMAYAAMNAASDDPRISNSELSRLELEYEDACEHLKDAQADVAKQDAENRLEEARRRWLTERN